MNNFKEIAEKCLKGKLSGIFILRNDARIPSWRLYKRPSRFEIVDPYSFNNLPYTYTDTGTRYPTYKEEYDVIDFIPDENMERNVKLTLEKAKEWYKQGGELKEVALQAYTEDELKSSYPKSWEEFCEKFKATNFVQSSIKHSTNGLVSIEIPFSNSYEESKKFADPFLALMKLMALRQAWIGEWKPDWNNTGKNKYCISYNSNTGFDIYVYTFYSSPLSFPTEELAKEFKSCFSDLLEKAKILL